MVQEYGRYFNLPTCALRGGCLTGPNHTGVELHGFLSYLVKCNLEGREYRVFGYKGKQVRDNIHSLDVVRFMAAFIESPRAGEVYNLGGGKANSTSILEAFKTVERFSGKAQVHTYVDQNRAGDHICYYSDLRKMRLHYPGFRTLPSRWRKPFGKSWKPGKSGQNPEVRVPVRLEPPLRGKQFDILVNRQPSCHRPRGMDRRQFAPESKFRSFTIQRVDFHRTPV